MEDEQRRRNELAAQEAHRLAEKADFDERRALKDSKWRNRRVVTARNPELALRSLSCLLVRS